MTHFRSLMLLAAVAVVAVGLNHVGALSHEASAAVPTAAAQQAIADEALAAPKWQALVWTVDGGSSIGYCVTSKNQTLELQQPILTEYCYRTCATTTCTADCTKDWRPALISLSPQFPADAGPTYLLASGKIEMGSDLCVAARALDAGNPALNLFLHTGNLK